MKKNHRIRQLLSPVLLGLAVTAVVTPGLAISDRIIDTFDTDISAIHDDGGVTKTIAWSGTNAGGSGSGSMYVSVQYPVGTGWNDSKVGVTDPAPGTDFAWP